MFAPHVTSLLLALALSPFALAGVVQGRDEPMVRIERDGVFTDIPQTCGYEKFQQLESLESSCVENPNKNTCKDFGTPLQYEATSLLFNCILANGGASPENTPYPSKWSNITYTYTKEDMTARLQLYQFTCQDYLENNEVFQSRVAEFPLSATATMTYKNTYPIDTPILWQGYSVLTADLARASTTILYPDA